MSHRGCLCLVTVLSLCLAPIPAVPQEPEVALELVTAASSPIAIWHARDARLFIVERRGTIRIFQNGNGLLPVPFLDISPLVGESSERGLYAIAFHPDYDSNGYFYVSYFSKEIQGSVVARYQVSSDPNVADPTSEAILFELPQPSGTHNAGQIAFSPTDGYLYLSLGDGGGGSHDLPCHAQRNDVLYGKLLRLDVNQNMNQPPYHGIPPDNPYVGANDPLDEIPDLVWAKGLRNPFRFSFDRATSDLLIGDVGEGSWEEVDYQPASSPGGENYGWKVMEGDSCHDADPIDTDCPPDTPSCFDPSYTAPVHVYPHSEGCAVIGGFVYRGSAIPALQGRYVFGDFCNGKIWALEELSPGNWGNRIELVATNGRIISFGEDAAGELYMADLTRVFRLISGAGRAEQSTLQQACINAMNRSGIEVARKRGRLNTTCVKFAGKGTLQRLGLPLDNLTLRACLDTDPRSRVQQSLDRLAIREGKTCLDPARPEQLPTFGYASSATVGSGAIAAATRLTESLLGADPDVAIVPAALDPSGARCQAEVARHTRSLFEAIWQKAREGKKGHLRGRWAQKAGTAEELAERVLGHVDADSGGTIQRKVTRLQRTVDDRCVGLSLDQLFPGECSSATASTAAFVDCVRERTRCHFCRSFETFDGLTIDCDAFDDGNTNGSCPTETERLCSLAPTGVNWLAAARADCPRLQDYHLFTDPSDPTAGANGGIPYDLTTPLFSDYALKYRFVFLPPGTQATYNTDDPLDFPVGTIIAKTFSFAHDLRDLGLGEEVIETRILIHREPGWDGLTYVWAPDMTVAVLTPDGTSAAVTWIDVAGNPRSTTYEIPSAAQCGHCHTGSPGQGDAPIGPKAGLLNRDYAYASGSANQLDHWTTIGALTGAPPGALAPRIPVWDDPSDGTLEQRARAYLESNCAHCHSPNGHAAFTELFLPYDQPLDQSYGICKQPIGSDGNSGLTYDIVPGLPDQSIVVFRMNATAEGAKMPELARSVVHEEGVALVASWIATLPGACP